MAAPSGPLRAKYRRRSRGRTRGEPVVGESRTADVLASGLVLNARPDDDQPATGSNGKVVGKECDHGPEVLVTDHASCSTRSLSRNSAGRRPIRAAGSPEERHSTRASASAPARPTRATRRSSVPLVAGSCTGSPSAATDASTTPFTSRRSARSASPLRGRAHLRAQARRDQDQAEQRPSTASS